LQINFEKDMRLFLICLLLSLNCLVFSQENSKTITAKDSKFNISFAVGPSFRLAKIPNDYPSDVKNYLKALKSGISYDFNLVYMINNKSGIGLKLNMYQSKGSLGPIDTVAPNGQEVSTRVFDNIKIYFFGPSYTISSSKNKDFFYSNLAVGYIGYVNDTQILYSYKIKGSSIGFTTDIAYLFGLNNNFQIGPKVSLIQGNIFKFEITGPNGYRETLKLDKNENESLLRIDLSVALRYKF
jgi:hypothetical protein